MLFNSYSFLLLFLPAVLWLYYSVKGPDARKLVLVFSSYVFYGAWSAKFAVLMLGTTSVDYFTAKRIEDSSDRHSRKRWLILSLASNLGVLGVFKYYDFFARSFNTATGSHLLGLAHFVLPIGISFYTFESMSYTIDVYRGRVHALRRFLDYAHFITMFPRLVAGPIVRYADMAAQLRTVPARLDSDRLAEAFHYFAFGLAKKVLVADWIASRLVEGAFHEPRALGFLPAWGAALGYSVQLYFDFSGYSDMAVGLALLLGFRLPRNFCLPYRSSSIGEFWRRWHITLSSWLRDYLYIPLGGNRLGPARTQLNLLVTMALGGLWHGASWTFVLWGLYHGVALVGEKWIPRPFWLPKWGSALMTFLVVVLGWVMFRAESLSAATEVYRAMLGWNGLGLVWAKANIGALIVLCGALAVSFTIDTADLPVAIRGRWAVATGVLVAVCFSRLGEPSPFLYFQF